MKHDLTPETLVNAIESLKRFSENSNPLLKPKIGSTFHDGVNTKTYRGNGVWKTTLVHDNREFNEKI